MVTPTHTDEVAASARPPISFVRRADRVVITLDRPRSRNAISRAMVDALHDVCAELERSPCVTVIVGAGSDFAAGADVAELRGRGREDALDGINSRLFDRIARLPLPTVAAVDGYAFGGGAELAYACDFRVASTRARFANPEASLGILGAAGATWRLRDLVGEAVAKEMLLAGRQLDANEALALHLVSRVVDPLDLIGAANDLVDAIVRNSSVALRLAKQVMAAPRAAHPLIDEIAQAVLFESAEKEERMRAFLGRKRNL